MSGDCSSEELLGEGLVLVFLLAYVRLNGAGPGEIFAFFLTSWYNCAGFLSCARLVFLMRLFPFWRRRCCALAHFSPLTSSYYDFSSFRAGKACQCSGPSPAFVLAPPSRRHKRDPHRPGTQRISHSFFSPSFLATTGFPIFKGAPPRPPFSFLPSLVRLSLVIDVSG